MNERLKNDWIINGLLAAILLLLLGNFMNNQAKSAFAAGGGWETDGVMVGLTSPQERLVLVDTTKQNIMVYHARPGGGIGLTGARSYKYDIEMEDSGTTKLAPNGWTYIQTAVEYNKSHKP